MTISLSDLISSETKEAILQKALDVASALGLETESWRSGDPTRSLFYAMAARFEEWEAEDKIPGFIRSGFLGLAAGDWLTLKAQQDYNVERRVATYATCTVRLTNGGSALVGLIAANAVTVRNSTTNKTYRNTSSGTLAAGPATYVDLDFTAEEAGSDSNSAIGEIDAMVTTISNVTCSNTTAATATDEEEDDALTARAQAKLGSISVNGPKGGYYYAATTPELQSDGISNVTRVRVVADSELGEVAVYLAGASGAVAGADVTKATETIDTWATPHAVSVTVASAANLSFAITYTLWVYDTISKTSAEIEDDVEAALTAAFADKAIGGDVIPPATTGTLYKDWVEAVILQAVAPHGFRVTLSAPSSDTAMAINQVAVLGTITPTINQVES